MPVGKPRRTVLPVLKWYNESEAAAMTARYKNKNAKVKIPPEGEIFPVLRKMFAAGRAALTRRHAADSAFLLPTDRLADNDRFRVRQVQRFGNRFFVKIAADDGAEPLDAA